MALSRIVLISFWERNLSLLESKMSNNSLVFTDGVCKKSRSSSKCSKFSVDSCLWDAWGRYFNICVKYWDFGTGIFLFWQMRSFCTSSLLILLELERSSRSFIKLIFLAVLQYCKYFWFLRIILRASWGPQRENVFKTCTRNWNKNKWNGESK